MKDSPPPAKRQNHGRYNYKGTGYPIKVAKTHTLMCTKTRGAHARKMQAFDDVKALLADVKAAFEQVPKYALIVVKQAFVLPVSACALWLSTQGYKSGVRYHHSLSLLS